MASQINSQPKALISIVIALLALLLITDTAHADIDNWQTGQVISGTWPGIAPGPGIDLSNWNTTGHDLEYADLSGTNRSLLLDLSGSSLCLFRSHKWQVCLRQPHERRLQQRQPDQCVYPRFQFTGAAFTGTIIQGTNLGNATGLTFAQIASTASFQQHDLTGTSLSGNDLTGWDFSNQNLTNAVFSSAILTGTNFTSATIQGAAFYDVGLTYSQLASTASYQQKSLTGISLNTNTLIGWDLSNQNLTNANFEYSTLNNANFSNANLTNASLDFSNLNNVNFTNANLTNANLSSTNRANANFTNANLTNASFFYSTVSGADFTDAIVQGTVFDDVDLTYAQLASTAGFQEKNLTGISLSGNDLTGWDLSNQNLTNANFGSSNMTGANLANANLSGAYLDSAILAKPLTSTVPTSKGRTLVAHTLSITMWVLPLASLPPRPVTSKIVSLESFLEAAI